MALLLAPRPSEAFRCLRGAAPPAAPNWALLLDLPPCLGPGVMILVVSKKVAYGEMCSFLHEGSSLLFFCRSYISLFKRRGGEQWAELGPLLVQAEHEQGFAHAGPGALRSLSGGRRCLRVSHTSFEDEEPGPVPGGFGVLTGRQEPSWAGALPPGV